MIKMAMKLFLYCCCRGDEKKGVPRKLRMVWFFGKVAKALFLKL